MLLNGLAKKSKMKAKKVNENMESYGMLLDEVF